MAGGEQLVLPASAETALLFPVAWERYTLLPRVDLICAGVPCQDVSIAGQRRGLAGSRTGLFYHFARLLKELRPAWFVFENVPGLFSSNQGRDFAEVLRVLMVECGYGVCWRVLDSQFFGVAQRRRRVFIVGCFGKPCPAQVLFESPSCERSDSTCAEAQQEVAMPLTGGSGNGGPPAGRRMEDDFNLAVLTASAGHHGHGSDRGDGNSLIAVIQDSRGGRNKRQNGMGISEAGPCYTLDTHSQHAVAYSLQGSGHNGEPEPGAAIVAHTIEAQRGQRYRGDGTENLIAGSLLSTDGGYSVDRACANNYVPCAPSHANGVRDFAGLPEGLDSARYRSLGNAVSVPVAKWIAERIKRVADER